MSTLKLRKKKLLFALSSSLVLTLAGVAMVTVFTAVTYARTCSKLTGFPGLLQKVGIVSAGPCVSKVGGTVCNKGAACTAAGGVAGTCKNIADASKPANCQCVATPVNQGLE
jgi:hypothetical protein